MTTSQTTLQSIPIFAASKNPSPAPAPEMKTSGNTFNQVLKNEVNNKVKKNPVDQVKAPNTQNNKPTAAPSDASTSAEVKETDKEDAKKADNEDHTELEPQASVDLSDPSALLAFVNTLSTLSNQDKSTANETADSMTATSLQGDQVSAFLIENNDTKTNITQNLSTPVEDVSFNGLMPKQDSTDTYVIEDSLEPPIPNQSSASSTPEIYPKSDTVQHLITPLSASPRELADANSNAQQVIAISDQNNLSSKDSLVKVKDGRVTQSDSGEKKNIQSQSDLEANFGLKVSDQNTKLNTDSITQSNIHSEIQAANVNTTILTPTQTTTVVNETQPSLKFALPPSEVDKNANQSDTISPTLLTGGAPTLATNTSKDRITLPTKNEESITDDSSVDAVVDTKGHNQSRLLTETNNFSKEFDAKLTQERQADFSASKLGTTKEASPTSDKLVNMSVTPAVAMSQEMISAPPISDHISPRVGSKGWDQALGQKIVWMVAGGDQSAQLTLNPPDLGPVQVVLSISDNFVDASFVSSHLDVREAIEAAAPKLREMMDNAGISLSGFSVSADTAQSGNAFSDAQAQRNINGQGRQIRDVDSGLDTPSAPTAARNVRQDQGLVDTFA